MATTVIFEERFEMPLSLQSLADFRRWALSDTCPETGRIDYVGGRIEVDMSPEDLFTHGTLKAEICSVLHGLSKQSQLGHLFTDSTRVSCPEAGWSAEPDIVLLSHDSISSGRVRLVPKSSGQPGRYVEIEGPPNMIAEIISDSSVTKDRQRLPEAYFQAGVGELWLVDARGEELLFQIHRPGPVGYVALTADADGFQASEVFSRSFRLDRTTDANGHWQFDLLAR